MLRFTQHCLLLWLLLVMLVPLSLRGAHAQAKGEPANAQADFVFIPFTPVAGHGGAVVTMELQDSSGKLVPYRFIVDTGAGACFLRRSVVKQLGYEIKNTSIVMSKDPTKPITVQIADAPRFRLGDVKGKITFAISGGDITDERLGSLYDAFGVDGVVGMNFLRWFCVLFDFPNQRIALDTRIGPLLPAISKELDTGRVSIVTLTNSEQEKMKLFATPSFAGLPDNIPLLLDTGADRTAIYWANSTDVVLPEKTFIGIWNSLSAQGDNLIRLHRVEEVKLRTSNVTPLVVGVGKSNTSETNGVLGMDFFAHFTILFDFPAKKMYLARPILPEGTLEKYSNPSLRANARRPVDSAFGVLAIEPSATGVWHIVSVEADNKAASKVKMGDEIVSVNDKPTSEFLPDELVALLNRKKKGQVQLRREGTTDLIRLSF
jgi:hypothetical protein